MPCSPGPEPSAGGVRLRLLVTEAVLLGSVAEHHPNER
jgi:hypothetical protein